MKGNREVETPSREEKRKKAEALNNSRPWNAWHVADHPEVTSALGQIFSEMEAAGLTNRRYEKKLKNHIRIIVLDLFVAHESDPTMYVSYSRNANKYGKKSRYSAWYLTYKNTIKVIDFLIDHGYVEGVGGIHDRINPERSRQSRMKATEKLIKLVRDVNNVTFPMIKWDDHEEVIILRDENGKDIDDYPDTEETKRMRENLKVINKALEKHSILLEVKDTELEALRKRLRKGPEKKAIDFSQKRLRRIFNVSFKRGGRFYGGWWENIPRDYRQYIRIDRKDTVELDYSGLHINMLYAMEGLPMPEGDVYALDGYPQGKGILRDFLKQMVLVMVNSLNREGTRKALHKEVHYKKTLKLPRQIKSTKGRDLFPLMDAFQKKHEGIKHYFNSGKGIDLQFLDSQLAEKVMLRISGDPILPMHDSFILHHGLEGELDEAMKEAFHEMFGQEIKVGLKYRSIEERRKENERKKKQQEREDTWRKKVQRRLDGFDSPLSRISPTLKDELLETICPEGEDPSSDKDKEDLIGTGLRVAELEIISKVVEIGSAAREQGGQDVMKEIKALLEAYGRIKARLENPKKWGHFYDVPIVVYFAERKEYGTYERLLHQHFALQSKREQTQLIGSIEPLVPEDNPPE